MGYFCYVPIPALLLDVRLHPQVRVSPFCSNCCLWWNIWHQEFFGKYPLSSDYHNCFFSKKKIKKFFMKSNTYRHTYTFLYLLYMQHFPWKWLAWRRLEAWLVKKEWRWWGRSWIIHTMVTEMCARTISCANIDRKLISFMLSICSTSWLRLMVDNASNAYFQFMQFLVFIKSGFLYKFEMSNAYLSHHAARFGTLVTLTAAIIFMSTG